jgi:DNA polymerase elongation subunit (family B)
MAERGKTVKEGEMVEFVYVNAKHHNPLCRISPIEAYDGKGYDKEKYRELLLDAAETVFSTLGFSRSEFRSKTKKDTYLDLIKNDNHNESFNLNRWLCGSPLPQEAGIQPFEDCPRAEKIL